MQLTVSFVLATLAMASGALAADPLVRTLMVDHVYDAAPPALWNAATPASVVSQTTLWDIVPRACLARAAEPMDGNPSVPNCERWNLEVKSVMFDDAPEPWIICRCNDTNYTEAELLAAVGRVPVGMRQFIRYVHAYQGHGQGAGFSDSDILVRGPSPHLFAHEVGHIIDLDQKYSNTQMFRYATQQDACWVTDYAWLGARAGGYHETWAEVFTLQRYRREVGPLTADRTCAAQQFAVVGQQTDAIISAGFNAANKPPQGEMVNKWAPLIRRSTVEKRKDKYSNESLCEGNPLKAVEKQE